MNEIEENELERLRTLARIERDAILERMMRAGKDPADVIAVVPSVDEFVVYGLRDELLEESGKLAEFSLARLAAQSDAPDAEEHQNNADALEFELLRKIAALAPDLTPAVWAVGGRLSV